MFDLIVRDGVVFDGAGGPGRAADIGIIADRIREIGDLSTATARNEIDAVGRYVLPGFIDAHVHGENAALDPQVQLAALRQGVTTFVLGQDGLSFAPATPAALHWVSRYFAAVNGSIAPHQIDLLEPRFSIAGLLEGYHRTTALNTAYLVPLGTVRYSVMGECSRIPDAQQLAAMVALVEEGIDHGAVGVSSGLSYLPGRFATITELAALSRPAARHGLPYVTHMRSYGNDAATGVREACAIGHRATVPVHISHYHGAGGPLLELVDTALASGLDLTYDTYPYLRGCSILSKMLPDWLATADLDQTLDALADHTVRKAITAETDPALWQRLTLAHVPSDRYRWTEGLRLCEAARRVGMAPDDFCAELLIATALGAGVVFEYPERNGMDSVRQLLRHDVHMGGSDGIYVGGHPHPRGFGAFARLLGRHVRELRDWTWAQAAVHLAARPACRFRLSDRGTIARGKVADLTIVAPTAVTDRATYATPRALAIGIDDVIVNGRPVLAGAQLTGVSAGTILRPC
ncbi:N-acyl-D-amino-acid deacylase family protein [Nocardia sp. CA-128927]|uniref:N-acyl-D-amino-acid deacylase family protein n=1 Tax=Nocardia sp. CA-128927 TaxID=3239975 RepID=UPI003D975490